MCYGHRARPASGARCPVVEQPPLLDDDLYDEVRPVSEAEGRAMARKLAEEGLFVGTSTGLNVAAAVEVAAS